MKHPSAKPTVDIAALDAMDIRVGTILRVEDVENSDKFVKLRVDFGEFQRTILVGMKKEREKPREIEGKQALFVVNLAPRKMAGTVSEGMLFDIGYAAHKAHRQQPYAHARGQQAEQGRHAHVAHIG